jgi:two-component system sensor kinase FixL
LFDAWLKISCASFQVTPCLNLSQLSYDQFSARAIDFLNSVSLVKRVFLVAACLGLIAGLIGAERYLGTEIPLGAVFLLPLGVAAAYLPRWPIFLLAIATAVAREYFGPVQSGPGAPERLILTMFAFAAVGLFSGELLRNRRMSAELRRKNELETRLRSDAELEARALVESSPAGVLTIDSDGKIARANAAARRTLGFESDSPEGDPVGQYVPLLARLHATSEGVKLTLTTFEANGRRRSGEPFFAQAWVSSYVAESGPCLVVILLDVTEQVRDREETGLKQLLSNSRIVAGAVSHELRNLAAAAAVLHLNLSKMAGFRDSADFQALGTVIQTAVKIASTELSEASEDALEGLDVGDLMQELRAIISPSLAEAGIKSVWEIHKELPGVRAERSGLLQIFLNLAKNSSRSLHGKEGGRVSIAAYEIGGTVIVRISDNGPGISTAERIFQPFQPGATSTGLGLFVSRAMIRTFGGELHHRQQPGECSFIVELPAIVARK